MKNKIHQKRYSDEFKRNVLEEIRRGKWASTRAVAAAYNISPATVTEWIDAAGLSHLRGRTVLVKSLGEVSEIQKLRKENKKLREQLIEEILSHRTDIKVLEFAGCEFGFKVASYRNKVINLVD